MRRDFDPTPTRAVVGVGERVFFAVAPAVQQVQSVA
jgi:hypothetical protein